MGLTAVALSRPTATRGLGLVASVLGYGVLLALVVSGFAGGQWPIPGGDVSIYLEAGERLRTGLPVYVAPYVTAFYYAPPLAVIAGALSYLPGWLVWAGLVALDVAGLRYLAGSWRRVGWIGLMPITAFQLVSGNPNFAIVAAILAAHRHHAGPLAWATLAKVGPVIAMPLARWRELAAMGAVAVALTLPWLGLWPEWVRFLVDAPRNLDWAPMVPILWRIPVVLGLLALRRPWAQMLAAALAIPGFYIVTAWATVLLAGRLWADRTRG